MILIQAIDFLYPNTVRGGRYAWKHNDLPRALEWNGGFEVTGDALVERWLVEHPQTVPESPTEVSDSLITIDEASMKRMLALDWTQEGDAWLVWFRGSEDGGTPGRDRRGSPDLRLRAGEWGQIEFNGTSHFGNGGDVGTWRYLHAVRNIAVATPKHGTDEIRAFTAKTPTEHRSHFSNLP